MLMLYSNNQILPINNVENKENLKTIENNNVQINTNQNNIKNNNFFIIISLLLIKFSGKLP